MKKNCNLVIFFCFLLFLCQNINCSTKIRSAARALFTREQLNQLWKDLFTKPRGTSCQEVEMKKRLKSEAKQEKEVDKNIFADKLVSESKFNWLKKWGYGPVSYLFDYLDSNFQKEAVKTFDKIFTAVMKKCKKDTKEYKDPFVKKENVDEAVYNLSVNAVQIRTIMKKWNWFIEPGQDDYAEKFIATYDINNDGRLNIRELILGTILHNRNAVSSGLCKNCLSGLARKFDAMFLFFDCDHKGVISAKELWQKLPKLKRKTNKYNIFSLNNKESIRTTSINDFVIKNGGSGSGGVNQDNFRMGLLLGFWDRQTKDTGIIKDDSRNLKQLRWKDNGMVDIVAYDSMKEEKLAKRTANNLKK